MVHLSNLTTMAIMAFYSFLTFFLGPLITRPFMKDHPDQCIAGFLLILLLVFSLDEIWTSLRKVK